LVALRGACRAALVAHTGKLRGILGLMGEEVLAAPETLVLSVAYERVGNAAEGALNRLLVDQERFLLAAPQLNARPSEVLPALKIGCVIDPLKVHSPDGRWRGWSGVYLEPGLRSR